MSGASRIAVSETVSFPAARAPSPAGRCRIACATLLGLAALCASGAEPAAPRREARLRLLYAESLFSQVNRNDAVAAIKVWVETLGRRRGFALIVEAGFYERVEEAQARIQDEEVDMITCTTLDFLRLETTGLVDGHFVPGWKQATDDYVVLVRGDRNVASLASLKGCSVGFYRSGSGLGRRWMETALREAGLGTVEEFFGARSESPKVSGVILPVFFGKADVAVANRYGWETMKEMNPQLAAKLRILTQSPSLPDAVICLRRSGRKHPFREDLLRGTLEMSDDPQGQQILLMFKTEKMVPFQPEQLDAVRLLAAQPAGSGMRPAAPPTALETRP